VLIQQTIEKLMDLRLKGMAGALQEQLERGDAALSFEDRFGLIVDREWTMRQEKRLDTRLQTAQLKQNACVEDINYRHPRGLDRNVVQDLISCRWIRAGRNVIICGPTGIGKTWLACAFANKACREGLTAHYDRVPRLLHELSTARADGTYLKQLKRLAKYDLVVLDDWALSPIDGPGMHSILEVIDDRAGVRSTLLTSQLPSSKWHGMVDDPSVADALMDRLLGGAVEMNLKGDSLRRPRGGESDA
jgi:DNA replication protein DnaC